MYTIVLTIHLIIILTLSGVILLQRNEGGGLGIGGGGNQGLGGRSAANPLTRVTWILTAAFIATSLALTMISAQESRSKGVLDGLTSEDIETNEGDIALPPALEGDALLPRF